MIFEARYNGWRGPSAEIGRVPAYQKQMKPSYEQEKKYYAIRKQGTDLYVDGTRPFPTCPFARISEKTWIATNKKTANAVAREIQNLLPAKIWRRGTKHQIVSVVRVKIINRIEEI